MSELSISASTEPTPDPEAATSVPAHRRVASRVRANWNDDRGEGVISAAIAVLIMAFLGVLMWVGLRGTWQSTER